MVVIGGVTVLFSASGDRKANGNDDAVGAAASAAPPTSMLIDRSAEVLEAAEEVVERLVVTVNKADSGKVIELLAPVVPAGLGSAAWPMAHGDIGWWDPSIAGARLNSERVTDLSATFAPYPAGYCCPGAPPSGRSQPPAG